MRFGLFIAIFFFFGTVDTFAQQKDEPIKVVEFSGKVVYEDENGNKITMFSGDFVQIEPQLKHWLNGIEDSNLLLIK